MDRRVVVAMAGVVLGLVLAAPGARAGTACEDEPNPTPDDVEFAPCELLVKFGPGADRAALIAAAGTELIANFQQELTASPLLDAPLDPGDVPPAVLDGADIDWLRVVDPDQTVADAIADLDASGQVVFATHNPIARPDGHQPTPDDPLFARKWELVNVGQVINRFPPNLGLPDEFKSLIDADIDAPQGWQLHQAVSPGNVDCRSLVVGVVDGGIDFTHDELAANAWTGQGNIHGANFTRVPATLDWDDDYGHGTFIAGLIAAHGNNAKDISGICWRASLMALRVSEFGVFTEGAAARAVLAAIGYNIDAANRGRPPIRVLNLSFGAAVKFNQPTLPSSALAVAIAIANLTDILVVAAAGNSALDLDAALDNGFTIWPCKAGEILKRLPFPLSLLTTPNLICVAASEYTDRDYDVTLDNVQVETSFGATTVDVAAPGQEVHSLSAAHDRGMNLYRHNGPGDTVVVGDRRLTRSTPPPPHKRDPAPVGVVDEDLGSRLVRIAADVKHTDEVVNNQAYDAGECIYRDLDLKVDGDGDPVVSPGDQRYTVQNCGPGTRIVAAGDGDENRKLRPFQADELKSTTVWNSGSSFAAPQVSGMAALCLSLPGFASVSSARMRELIMRFADRKDFLPPTASGRLRWPCTADLGDLHQPAGQACGYHTLQREPLMRLGTPALTATDCRGPVHLDTGNEWLGDAVSNEHNADTPRPRDEDPAANHPNQDRFDDGSGRFVFDANGFVTDMTVPVCSDVFGMNDEEGGRYGSASRRLLYLRGYFDWDGNGVFDPSENNLFRNYDPTAGPLGFPAGSTPNVVGLAPRCRTLDVPLDAPPPRPGLPAAWRLRLDYGEDAGNRTPLRYRQKDARPAQGHLDIALFGEVEDQVGGDHYLCYRAHDRSEPPTEREVVTLTDQFYRATYRRQRPRRLCTPADKNAEGVLDRTTHLAGYGITRIDGEVGGGVVEVQNQFGTVRLNPVRETELLVPTAKALDAQPAPPDPMLPGFEHYKCYRTVVVGTRPRKRLVEVVDQFGTMTYVVGRPKALCNPVAKQRATGPLEPIRNPLRHLVCYHASPLARLVPTDVRTQNQFGAERLALKCAHELCVPSLKRFVGSASAADVPDP